MGSGKSVLGRKLSKKLKISFIDIDELIEIKTGQKVSEIFSNKGENVFRETEHECLKEIILNENIVVATGGGTPCFYDNMEIINNNGISVYLKYNPGILASRLISSSIERPLIKQLNDKKALKLYIEELLEKREKYYLKSKYVIEEKNISVKKLIEVFSKEKVANKT